MVERQAKQEGGGLQPWRAASVMCHQRVLELILSVVLLPGRMAPELRETHSNVRKKQEGTASGSPGGWPWIDHQKCLSKCSYRWVKLQGIHHDAPQWKEPHPFACNPKSRRLLVIKGKERSDGAGAKSLGLENHYKWKLLTSTVCLSTKSRLNNSCQCWETFLFVLVPALASLAVPFNLAEHVDGDKVIPGNLGLCMFLQGQRCVRMVPNGFLNGWEA